VVAKLIFAPGDHGRACICDECIGVCNALLKDDPADQRARVVPEGSIFQTPFEKATPSAQRIAERIQKLEAKARSKVKEREAPARRVVLGLGISLDGYIARKNGAVDFLFMPRDYSMAPFFKTVDTAIMGRKTYDAAVAMGGGSFGKSMNSYVFSHSLPAGECNGVTITSQTPASLIAEIRTRKGKNIWLMGGGELAREFLKADLVDELYLGVVPVLLGEGIPLFPGGFPQRDFRLIENKTYSQGLIALKYERSVQKTK
jgi:dihydrofolate reductase